MKNVFLTFLSLFCALAMQAQTIQFPATKDAWVWSHPTFGQINFGTANSQNSGLHNVIRAESWQWIAGRDDTIRGLIDFDLDSLMGQSASIQKATLVLKYFANTNFTKQVGQNAFELFVVTENWNESTVNWPNKPNYDPSVSVAAAKSATDTQSYSLDVTTLVQHFLTNQGEGFYMKLQNEQPFSGVTFASREHSMAALHPKLIIELSGAVGLREHATNFKFNNPFGEQLRLETQDEKPYRLLLISTSGKVILDETVKGTETFDTRHLPKGMYVLKVDEAEYKLLK